MKNDKINNLTDKDKEEREKILQDIYRTVSDNVQELRTKNKETWDYFSEKTQIKPNTVTGWARIATKPSAPNIKPLIMIAAHYNVSIDWLLGLDNEKDTYEYWINFIEESLDNGIFENQYYPTLDDYEDSEGGPFEHSKEEKELLKQCMKLKFGNDCDGLDDDNTYDDINMEYPSSARVVPGPPYEYERDHIYDVQKDMKGTFPDVLKVKDTFLRCLLACMECAYRDNKYAYVEYKEEIIKKYGKEKFLNFDVYDFGSVDDIERYRKKGYFKNNERISQISYSVFGHYKGISDIFDDYKFFKLDRILNELKFWKKEAEQGNLKKVKKHKRDFF